jgi:hypothetical protein
MNNRKNFYMQITKASTFLFFRKFYKSKLSYDKAEKTLKGFYDDIINYDYALFYKLMAEFEF